MNDYKRYFNSEMKDDEKTEREEVKDFILELADYIAYNNKDFICSTCLETLDRLKDFMYSFYGMHAYCEICDIIDSYMEDDEE